MNLNPFKTVFKDALPLLEKFSPTIATAIGGPPGLVLSFIIPMLAKAFSSNPHNISDLVANIVKDEHSPVKLQALENDHHDWLCAVMDNANNLTSAEINVKLEWNKKS